MKLDEKSLFLLRQCAITAAYQAGKFIKKQTLTDFDIQKKTGGNSKASQIFTEIDIKSQKIILANLRPTCKYFDLGMLTEEQADDKSRLEKDYYWCIDPLDGTLPFTEGKNGYSVSISLVSRQGEAVIGVIYNPVKDDIYYAIKNKGAFKNNALSYKKILKSSNTDFYFIMDRSFKQYRHYNQIYQLLENTVKEMGYSKLKIIDHGGAAMNAIWVLDHAPAVYFKFPKQKKGGGSLWDYAATSCIFHELGAHSSDIFMKELKLNQPDSTFMNKNGIFYASDLNLANFIHKNVISKYLD
jgi:fructose-1,6-bisphosphatase/inositol monophosphatase family enzyme